jgi:uncharacterized protein
MSEADKLERLITLCRSLKSLAVAFSGGLDSRFLCHTASRNHIPVRALHVSGPHIPRRETEEARQWAEARGIPFVPLHADPLSVAAIRANGPDRCYHCKHAVFTALFANVAKGETLCDGTNTSDLTGYRPGLRALKELGVASPLAETGLSKDDIRSFARATGMDRPEQKARPCLFTRYEYGLEPDAASLAALDAAEHQVEEFFASDGASPGPVPPFRLRLTADGPVLHVQTATLADATKNTLSVLLRNGGFADSRVETVEQISGFFDRQRNFVPS